MLSIQNSYDFKKLDPSIPLLRSTGGNIIDFGISPFNDQLLITASEDAVLRMWVIPEDGLTTDVTEPDGELKGHSKKIALMRFHPCADYTMATTALDNSVKIWDIARQESSTQFRDLKNNCTSMEWSHNGSLLAVTTKDKTLTVFDPRLEGSALNVGIHEGGKPQKLCWLGDSQTILTTGFSKTSDRQYGVWDIRDLSNPLCLRRMDDNTGVAFPFFDEDNKIVYIATRGETATSMF